ncbi:MAG: gamma-glutamyl-gamma-aminobutyrate hydrolase family protein [Tenuifilaceae bacterium]|jgi:putative glutamine amidotransferase|nr:gamma-glutamyl-gamma-aminobutyrate hydrolase family protein [Tenuifilaceae bacterium]
MRRFLVILLLVTVLAGCWNNKRNMIIGNENLPTFQPAIVLMHPTVSNLKTFISLTEQGVFPFPNDAHVLGVYHAQGDYDYSQSVKFLEDLNNPRFALLPVSGDLKPDNLYKKNECSDVFSSIFRNSRGIIFFGGPDMPPATYKQQTNLLTSITDAHRHYLELSFLFHLLGGSQDEDYTPLLESSNEYAVLGICLGMQSMNVATGGTMVQDIPTEIYGLTTVEEVFALDENMQHRNYYTNLGVDPDLIWGHFHQVKFEKGSLFDSLNENSETLPYIWSSHHQALGRLGQGIIPIAWSEDGKIVEAICHGKYPNVLGVQFHPEVPAIYDADSKLKRRPFEQEQQSYIDLYPNGKGEDFHRAFWQMVGAWYKR